MRPDSRQLRAPVALGGEDRELARGLVELLVSTPSPHAVVRVGVVRLRRQTAGNCLWAPRAVAIPAQARIAHAQVVGVGPPWMTPSMVWSAASRSPFLPARRQQHLRVGGLGIQPQRFAAAFSPAELVEAQGDQSQRVNGRRSVAGARRPASAAARAPVLLLGFRRQEQRHVPEAVGLAAG